MAARHYPSKLPNALIPSPAITRQGVTHLHSFQFQGTPYTQTTPYRDVWANDVWPSSDVWPHNNVYSSSGSGSWQSPHSASSGTGPSPSYIQNPLEQYPVHVYEQLKQKSSSKKQQQQQYKRLPPMEMHAYHQGDVARQHHQGDVARQRHHNGHSETQTVSQALTPHHKNTHRYSSSKPKPTSLSNTKVSFERDHRVRALGPIRSSHDPTLGERHTDPLSPSNMDYQRRGEDEAAKFFHLVIRHASTLGLKINYEDPEEREASGKGISQDPSKILGKFSLDFRWQMKHLQFNRTIYCKSVFSGQGIDEDYLLNVSRELRRIADTMAHKQYLPDSYQEKENVSDTSSIRCGTVQCILRFFQHMITFVDKVLEDMEHIDIPGLQKHSENLKVISEDFRENVTYQETFHQNCHEYDKLTDEERDRTYNRVLQRLHQQEALSTKDSSDWKKMIVIKFASSANLKITDLE